MLPHFVCWLKGLMPQAAWSEHEGIPVATVSEEERYLVGTVSGWKKIAEINLKRPFPRPMKPLLLLDTSHPLDVPKGEWLMADISGVSHAEGRKPGKLSVPIGKAAPVPCGKSGCHVCTITSAFGGYPNI